jgi:hypothetical protein
MNPEKQQLIDELFANDNIREATPQHSGGAGDKQKHIPRL